MLALRRETRGAEHGAVPHRCLVADRPKAESLRLALELQLPLLIEETVGRRSWLFLPIAKLAPHTCDPLALRDLTLYIQKDKSS